MDSELQSYDKIPSEIFCIFKTAMPAAYKIPETPISISTEFNEAALSQLITQLLTEQNDSEDPISNKFEFLIKDEFLRGNLKSHIMKHTISSETNLIIHYCLALNKPKLIEKVLLEDWISSISLLNETEGPLMVGTFNGSLKLYSSKGEDLLGETEIKGKTLKTIKSFPNFLKSEEAFSHMVYSGHSDELIRVSFFNFQEKKSHKKTVKLEVSTKVLCKGHSSSIETIATHPLDNSYFTAGSYDGELTLWHIKDLELLVESQGVSVEGTRKKIKLSPIREMKPSCKVKLHNDNISKIVWERPENLITGSFDHNIKMFDVEKTQEIACLQSRDTAVTGLGLIGRNNVISGHEDGYLRLWDFREKTAKKLMKSHNLWVSEVKSLQSNEMVFASSGYDKSVKIWDIRSDFPLFNLKSHSDKVFCLEWNGDNVLASGGSDSELHIYEF